MRFFKDWDNDTTIQSEEKEGKTDVSSTPKLFYDHYSGFWQNLDFFFFFLIFWVLEWQSVQKAHKSSKGGNRKSKNEIFSKTAVVVVKHF